MIVIYTYRCSLHGPSKDIFRFFIELFSDPGGEYLALVLPLHERHTTAMVMINKQKPTKAATPINTHFVVSSIVTFVTDSSQGSTGVVGGSELTTVALYFLASTS